MTKSIKPESLKTAVQKQLQLQRNKALKSDVFRYVNWLRTFAAGHQLYVGLDDEPKPSPAAKPAETIVPKNAEPSAKKGCLKCGDMSHRVERPRLAKPKRCWQRK
ncbi:hypothetical protein DYB36_008948 [Aphanomyces astaci]|uniref:Uncharacterized protein n=1 Tax=Aphanomyces astaci TaxID=112090 RepID=A0A397AKV7_APHAT|nr:hypothetical protein DYB36_008948 [Aphanomyces astaci]